VHHIFFLELHRERITRFEREAAQRRLLTTSKTSANPSARAGVRRRRLRRLVARNAC
jgi:hypothetical protein